MIEIKHLTKSFGKKTVLSNLSATFNRGEIVFVLGKSGVGKSVLLKHIVGLLKADSGEIVVDGVEVSGLKERELAGIRKKCGMVFQFPALLDSLSGFENVSFGMRSHKLFSLESEMREMAEKIVKQVALPPSVLDRYPSELSFGEQKRLAVARALAVNPTYLLFDEPTTSLDPVTTSSLNELISHLAKSLQLGCVVVSHDLVSALKIADRIILLGDGVKQFDGVREEFPLSENPLARAFFREAERYAD